MGCLFSAFPFSTYSVVDELPAIESVHHCGVGKASKCPKHILYIKAYLGREIRACKDLITPELSMIEKNINRQIGIDDYSDDLQSQHTETLNILSQELADRKEMQLALKNLRKEHNNVLEKLEKKRKFLDELPAFVRNVRSSTIELKSQFDSKTIISPSNYDY